VAFAYHDPKKMPAFEPTGQADKPRNPEADAIRLREYLKARAKRAKG